MPDHAHILIGLNPQYAISDIVKVLKVESSNFINNKGFLPYAFQWQTGYGVFSYSKIHLNNVVQYIRNQPEHHKKQVFKNEFKSLLKEFQVDFNAKYLFDFFD